MNIKFDSKGDYSKLTRYFEQLKQKSKPTSTLDKYGVQGVNALSSATPVKTGLTANSWYYEVETKGNITKITFCNSNVVNDWCNIAIILDTGHGTRNGGWVQGRQYIEPSIQPIFDKIVEDAWKEVTNL